MKKEDHLKQLDELKLFNLPVEDILRSTITSGGREIVDFVNTNYLGFSNNPHIHRTASTFVEKWGSLSGWSRMELDPVIYTHLENRIASFIKAPKVLMSHTITITNFSIIPGIVKNGTIIADSIVHAVVWEACRLARDHGANLLKFEHQNLDHLETILKGLPKDQTKLIAVDGVYSISTELAPINELQYLCEKYNAWLYIDDAHGFGILGERPSVDYPIGHFGTGIVNYFQSNYNRTFYVSSFGKAFCVNAAFCVIPSEFQENLRAFCTQYLFSAPISPYTVGQVHAALDLNEKIGEDARTHITNLASHFVDGLKNMNFKYLNHLYQPVIFVEIGEFDAFTNAAKKMEEMGFIAGLRAFPLVPADKCGFRFAITAQHTIKEIDRTLNALNELTHKDQRITKSA